MATLRSMSQSNSYHSKPVDCARRTQSAALDVQIRSFATKQLFGHGSILILIDRLTFTQYLLECDLIYFKLAAVRFSLLLAPYLRSSARRYQDFRYFCTLPA